VSGPFWPQVKFIFERTDGQGTRDEIDPRIGFPLIPESAIAMSKLDPAKVRQETRAAKSSRAAPRLTSEITFCKEK
jgi:hypothetical protein